MKLSEIIKGREIDVSPSPIQASDIGMAEAFLGVKIGDQLQEYLTEYGYIGCGFVEMYGINSKMGSRSSMIKRTVSLHEHHPKTKNLIVIEDQGDGDYYLTDSNDKIYRYLESRNELTDMDMTLFDYIAQRLSLTD